MSTPAKAGKSTARRPVMVQPRRLVIGMESEFTLYVDEEKRKPEDVFGSPRAFVRAPMMHRTGRSYHLPTGGAVYFDTGVIEVATPIIEIEPGCCVRVVRSLWEQIEFLRTELDAWEAETGRRVRLEGFSTHYNISLPPERQMGDVEGLRFALLLAHILPLPVMLLAANRMSTGIGVRPRGNRIEITADFTPDPYLMIAAASLIFGIVTAVSAWTDFRLGNLATRELPVIRGFRPRKHTSRKGWLARFDCFPKSPFECDVNAPDWRLRDGRTASLREAAEEIAEHFRDPIREMCDEDAYEHIFAVLDGRARSLLDFEERPPRYADVGRVIDWSRRAMRTLPRSAYERVIQRIITGKALRIDGVRYRPVRMLGWYEVIFENCATRRRRLFNLDDLVRHVGRPG